MKIKVSDWQHGLNITMEPETVEESTMLLRFAINASSEKPSVHLYFEKAMTCYISLHKRKYTVQKFSIDPTTK